MSYASETIALVLGAGKGTRMLSKEPKVLQTLIDVPLLYYPLAELKKVGPASTVVVTGHQSESVKEYLAKDFPDVRTVFQKDQLGTGHAVSVSSDSWKAYKNVLVMPGDIPLLKSATLNALLEKHNSEKNLCTFLTFNAEDPTGYGRIVRGGQFLKIVEETDATLSEKFITEVNSGIYIFSTEILKEQLKRLDTVNAQGELYLTDVVSLIHKDHGRVSTLLCDDSEQLQGVNNSVQLSEVSVIMRSRINNGWMDRGVKMADPASVLISPEAILGSDIYVEPFVQIFGRSRIEDGVHISSFSQVRDSAVGSETRLLNHVIIHDSRIDSDVTVGPFCFIRNGSIVEDHAFIGKFVEVKKSHIGEYSKVPHLSYIGDARIGRNTNIGAGTITCNYDGIKKYKTTVGNNCFVGSDTMLIAPVKLEDDSFTGAGSVVSSDVPEGALAVARAKQKNIPGWAKRVNKKAKEQEGG